MEKQFWVLVVGVVMQKEGQDAFVFLKADVHKTNHN